MDNYKIGMDLGNTGSPTTTIEVIKNTSDMEIKVKELLSTLTEEELNMLKSNFNQYINEETSLRLCKNHKVGMCFLSSNSVCDEYYKILSIDLERCAFNCEFIRMNYDYIAIDRTNVSPYLLLFRSQISPEVYGNVKRIAQKYICEKDVRIRKTVNEIKELRK